MSKLIIAEKPSVARAICPVVGASSKKNGYVEGNGYIVSWCFGHLVGLQLPNGYGGTWAEKWSFNNLPMIPEKWKFIISEGAANQFNILKKLLNDNSVDEVICATDADREGECIFRYVYNLSGSRKPVKRLWVSSLEESAIQDGLKKLKSDREYDNLYNAGFCRAKADWLVGMNGSRLFSIRYRAHLNIGRVQTPTLAMIVKRDYDVKNFVKQKYFTVDLNCGNFKAVSERIDNEVIAKQLAANCIGKTAEAIEVKREVKTVNPPKLFDLTTLQREANKKYGYTAQQTLDYQQSLYEKKLTTYPRTDSQYITDDMEETALAAAKTASAVLNCDVIGTPDIKRCINNAKVTGHHAIIPTLEIANADLSALPEGELNVLKLIANRLICAVSEPHKYEAVKITIECENKNFTANGKSVISEGWKSAESYIKDNSEVEEKEPEAKLPPIAQGQQFENVQSEISEHFTSPPKPYTEDTLLSAMEHAGQDEYDDDSEKKGLGTPATRAGTIEGLVKNGYIERKKKQLTATEKGIKLIEVVPDDVTSPKLTANWEMRLQAIEHGIESKDSFMSDISDYVIEMCRKYSSIDNEMSFVPNIEPIGKCPKCGNDVKKGKFGFYCTHKCGMNVAKVFGKELTENQLKNLLAGKEISYTVNGRKTTVIPKVSSNEYNGKTLYQWETKSVQQPKKG